VKPETLIFVISLRRSADRRRATAEQLAAIGLRPTFVDACDAADAVAAVPPAPGLSAAEAACLATHVAVWRRVIEIGAPYACVLEDDCDLGAPFARVLAAIAGGGGHGWDVLLLGHHSARYGPDAGAATCFRGAPIIAGYRGARVAEFAMGAYAYLVTPRGARALAAHAAPPRMPADWVTGYAPAAGARLHAVTPPCVRPLAGVASTIADRGPRSGPVDPPGRDRSPRALAGEAWLFLRRLGVFPAAYVRRL
jgi:glycosyl transferase family 25